MFSCRTERSCLSEDWCHTLQSGPSSLHQVRGLVTYVLERVRAHAVTASYRRINLAAVKSVSLYLLFKLS